MSQGLNGGRRAVSENESNWWVEFGAGVESRQHLGGELRGMLLNEAQEAAKQGSLTAFRSCVRLGLHDEAWQIHASNPEWIENSEWIEKFAAEIYSEAVDYSKWLLGYARRPEPAGVTNSHRFWASSALGQAAVRNPSALQFLVEAAQQHCHPNRPWAIKALEWPLQKGQKVALVTLASIALDKSDSSRKNAFYVLRHTALLLDHSASIEVMARIALDHTDGLRDFAITVLMYECAARHELATFTLATIALDYTDSRRQYDACDGLVWAYLNPVYGNPDVGYNDRWEAVDNLLEATKTLVDLVSGMLLLFLQPPAEARPGVHSG